MTLEFELLVTMLACQCFCLVVSALIRNAWYQINAHLLKGYTVYAWLSVTHVSLQELYK